MTKKKQKRTIDVRVAGPNYVDKDPIKSTMDLLEQYEEGCQPRKPIGCNCDHQGE
ncbi:hypothetical protein HY493_00835 [Candidatus Woesearchaeota archaeon]|nr:hypothetical protein [Candidatus Woesearchaeota archaeon]